MLFVLVQIQLALFFKEVLMRHLQDDGTPVSETSKAELKTTVQKMYRIASGFYEHGRVQDEAMVRIVLLDLMDVALKGLGVRKRKPTRRQRFVMWINRNPLAFTFLLLFVSFGIALAILRFLV